MRLKWMPEHTQYLKKVMETNDVIDLDEVYKHLPNFNAQTICKYARKIAKQKGYALKGAWSKDTIIKILKDPNDPDHYEIEKKKPKESFDKRTVPKWMCMCEMDGEPIWISVTAPRDSIEVHLRKVYRGLGKLVKVVPMEEYTPNNGGLVAKESGSLGGNTIAYHVGKSRRK